MIQLRDYFGRFNGHEEVTEDVLKNATKLIAKVSTLLRLIPIDNVTITSGFRTKKYNEKRGGSKNSTHCTGEGIDLHDPDETIGKWAQSNIGYLREENIYMESLAVTHKSEKPSGKWVHLQVKPPRSCNQIFLP